MIGRIWQQLVRLFKQIVGFFNNSSAEPEPAAVPPVQPLSDAELEHYFLQLLDGIHKGWQQVKVRRFFEAFGDRATDERWSEWLQRFGRNLLASPVSNHELGRRLLRLGELGYGDISTVARNLGQQILAREAPPETQVESEAPSTPDLGDRPTSEPTATPVGVNPPPDREEQMAEQVSVPLLMSESVNGVQEGELPPLAPPPDLERDRPSVAPSMVEEPQEASGWFDRGVERLNAGDDKGAIAALDRAIAIEPHHSRAWSNRGKALLNLERLDDALEAFNSAIEIQPEDGLAWSNRGDVLFDLDRVDEAIASWDKALEINPDDAETHYNKGLALGVKLGRWEPALLSLEKALEINPNDAQSWFYRGIALAALERLEEALASWEKTTELKRDFRDAWINKGVVLQKLGRYTEAIEANNQAIGLFSA